jgi:hypothetical protein
MDESSDSLEDRFECAAETRVERPKWLKTGILVFDCSCPEHVEKRFSAFVLS